MPGTRCPFCDNDPFDYVDNGLGMVPVAVTCCHLGRDYWDDDGDEITKKAGDEITGSRVTIASLRALNEELVGALDKAAVRFKHAAMKMDQAGMMTGNDRMDHVAWLQGAEYEARAVLALAQTMGNTDRSFPEAGDGRPTLPMQAELWAAGCDHETARFVATQLRAAGSVLVPMEPTEAMRGAFGALFTPDEFARLYRDMLAAMEQKP